MGLLEVIPEDLFKLESTSAFGIHLIGPPDKVDVQYGARSFQQSAINSVAHKMVMKPIDRLRVG